MERTVFLAAILLSMTLPVTAQSDAMLPENITVEIGQVNGEFYTSEGNLAGTVSDLDYPYAVTEREETFTGIVSYGDFLQLRKDGNTVSMTQSSSGFLIPLTKGDRSIVESRESEITGREFLQSLSPTFAFTEPADPLVRISLDSRYEIDSFQETIEGKSDIQVRNKGLVDNELVIEVTRK